MDQRMNKQLKIVRCKIVHSCRSEVQENQHDYYYLCPIPEVEKGDYVFGQQGMWTKTIILLKVMETFEMSRLEICKSDIKGLKILSKKPSVIINKINDINLDKRFKQASKLVFKNNDIFKNIRKLIRENKI